MFEGSNDGKEYLIIKQHNNDSALAITNQSASWKIDPKDSSAGAKGQAFRFLRIRQQGSNSGGTNNLCCAGFEGEAPPLCLPPFFGRAVLIASSVSCP